MTKRQQGKGKKGRLRKPKPNTRFSKMIKKIDKAVSDSHEDPIDLLPDPSIYKKPI